MLHSESPHDSLNSTYFHMTVFTELLLDECVRLTAANRADSILAYAYPNLQSFSDALVEWGPDSIKVFCRRH